MSAGESQSEEETEVRPHLLFKAGRTNFSYRVGSLPCAVAEEDTSILSIAELGGRLIVALPQEVWHRQIARRKVKQNTLGKAILVEVVGAAPQDPEVPLPEVTIKLWVGVLAMEQDALISYEREAGDMKYQFAPTVLPYAPALVSMADEHFAFTTAESNGGPEGIFKRMSAVESGLAEIKAMIANLGSMDAEKVADPAQEPREKARGARSKALAAPRRTAMGGLDPATVAAARAAGVEDSALQEMGKLLAAKRLKKPEDVGRKAQHGGRSRPGRGRLCRGPGGAEPRRAGPGREPNGGRSFAAHEDREYFGSPGSGQQAGLGECVGRRREQREWRSAEPRARTEKRSGSALPHQGLRRESKAIYEALERQMMLDFQVARWPHRGQGFPTTPAAMVWRGAGWPQRAGSATSSITFGGRGRSQAYGTTLFRTT